MYFRDREDAGRRLAETLARFQYTQDSRPLILALPRGGVVVGYEVAHALSAPLDVFVVRKIGAPFQPELGIGAVAEDGTLVADANLTALFGITREMLEVLAERRLAEIRTRVKLFRGDRPMIDIAGKTAIVVDDGLATGVTAHAAVRALREKRPAKLVLAVPVAAAQTVAALSPEVDELVCLETPFDFGAVGNWYVDFRQVEDEEVKAFLERAQQWTPAAEGRHVQ